jgi:hypothetical protein
MGLNAVVYRNREHLPFNPDQLGATLDKRTGEYYVLDNTSGDLDQEAVVALSRRLGNVNAIEELADTVRRLIGPKSLLESRVLFSGTHAGDVIELDSMRQLSNELEQVRRKANVRHESVLSEFVRSMEDLVNVAVTEGNPIVFT